MVYGLRRGRFGCKRSPTSTFEDDKVGELEDDKVGELGDGKVGRDLGMFGHDFTCHPWAIFRI